MALKYNFLFAFFMFISSYELLATPPDSLRTEKQKGKIMVVHQVEQGETLYSISKRYDAELKEIVKANKIENNTISLGQLIYIPITKEKNTKPVRTEKVDSLVVQAPPLKADSTKESESQKRYHVVQPKETLYSISKMYGISIDQIKKINSLESNALSVGQSLIVSEKTGNNNIESKKSEPKSKPTLEGGFNEYLVQSGDMLESIARKYNVRPDSIIIWNKLSNTYLAIGQRLIIKGEVDSLAQMVEPKREETAYSQKTKFIDQSGFTKVLEEGVAKKIEEVIETDKYLAMHRTLKVGTMVEVRNLMNNKKIFVRIVGRLPETGLNENTLIRMTPICFTKLGVIDPKARVEISYYEE